jgi:alkanesulfonate monooxygenase SsuD/methylene tetrahydromethanopterin reductase-like flavin-dependent oxidoreductase (luciferase family)
VSFERIWSWPKPAQKPHPPILVGGDGPRVLDRVLAYGDEWMPNRIGDEELAARIGELQSRAAEVGRERIPVTVVGTAPDAARIDRLAEVGVDRVVLWLPPESADTVEEGFDRYAGVMEQVQAAG